MWAPNAAEAKKDIRLPGTEVTVAVSCCVGSGAGMEPDALEEQTMLLTAEPPLQRLLFFFKTGSHVVQAGLEPNCI